MRDLDLIAIFFFLLSAAPVYTLSIAIEKEKNPGKVEKREKDQSIIFQDD